MVEFILFDLDGTLTDPKEGITKCVAHALKYFGIERDAEKLTEFIGPPLKEQFMEYASLSESDAIKAVEVYRERFAPIGKFENKVYDNIHYVLEQLRNNRKTLAIATSKPLIFAKQIADKFELSPYLEGVYGSELDGRNTDKALVIKEAMEKMGANSTNTVMVGDRIHDLIGAKKNNIPFVGVAYGYAKKGELEAGGAEIIAKSPLELLEILISM